MTKQATAKTNDSKRQMGSRSELNPAHVPKDEFITLAGLAAALGLGASASEKTYEILQSRQQPLSIQVLKSDAIEGAHIIGFHVTNNTQHGVYLEKISFEKPKDAKATIYSSLKMGEFTNKLKELSLPMLIPPRQGSGVTVAMALREDEATKEKPYGTLELEFSKLDEKKAERVKTDFRIRW